MKINACSASVAASGKKRTDLTTGFGANSNRLLMGLGNSFEASFKATVTRGLCTKR